MKQYPFLTVNCLAYIVLQEKLKMPQANTFAARYYYRILCAEIKICEHRLPLLISYQSLPLSLMNVKCNMQI